MDGDRPGGVTDTGVTAGPPEGPSRRGRRVAYARLGTLVALLAAAFAAFWFFDLVDRSDVRAWVDAFGPLAPLGYVVVTTALGAALVPGPILAGTGGLLFGPLVGTLVAVAGSILTSIVALLLARRAAGGAYREVAGPRMEALAELAERHGIAAVIVARLAPVLPDAPVSYLFGVLGLRVWQIAVGTAIGATPRAFSYTSIGASLDDPGSPLALVGIGGVVVTGLVGAALAARVLRRSRPSSHARRPPRRSGAARGRTPPSAG